MRRRRLARPAADLLEMKYHELADLAQRGVITWSEVARVTCDQIRARGGDPDRWDHLRGLDDDDPGVTLEPLR